jgi:regulatory protein
MELIGRVTQVERQKRNGSRVSVFVDGAYLGSVEDIVWAKAGLKAGDGLPAALWEDMQGRQEALAALDRALTRLGPRARSRAEMVKYLLGRGFSEEAVNRAVEKLETYGYIDDADYAAMLVRDRVNLKHTGRRAIAGELKRLGIGEEEAEAALAQYGEEDELAAAVHQAEKDMKRTAGERDERKRRAKVYAGLARRGFSQDIIREAMGKLFRDSGDDDLPVP